MHTECTLSDVRIEFISFLSKLKRYLYLFSKDTWLRKKVIMNNWFLNNLSFLCLQELQ